MTVPSVRLNDGNSIPQLGLGVWQTPADATERAVAAALATGYRHIDTAAAYRNERQTGRAIAGCGLPRDEVFVVTKLWNADQGYDTTMTAFDASMNRLGLDYLDLYLIHWPMPAKNAFVETFKAFSDLRDQGRIKSIGVSNFEPEHLQILVDATGIVPTVNQIELHPLLPQRELREANARLGIATEAYSPLGQGSLLTDPTVTAVAGRHQKTAAQVLIRWHIQLGNIVIPKSVDPVRIASNFDVFDFELSEQDMTSISALENGTRLSADPRTFNWTGRNMTSATAIPTVSLNDDNTIPVIGLGVGELSDAETESAVLTALQAGYRLIDTAAAYGNEAAVGRAIAASGVDRAEIFVTTKLATPDQGFQSSQNALRASLERLGLDYVDLYLIHWPAETQGKYVDSWGGMMKVREDGLARSIGVCNFTPDHLSTIIELAFFTPAVNQIELHPLLNQAEMRATNADHGIVTEAYGPLGVGALLDNPAIVGVAQAHGKSPAQVLIRWSIQLGNVVIPRSSNPDRIQQNLDVFDFELTEDEMNTLNGLDDGTRFRPNPDEYSGI